MATTASTGPNRAVIASARRRHSRSVRGGCSNTRIFCRNTGEWRPDDRTKWPSISAPAARNSASTGSSPDRVALAMPAL